jgi:hypothetical protein
MGFTTNNFGATEAEIFSHGDIKYYLTIYKMIVKH